jgi:hypothetical protein
MEKGNITSSRPKSCVGWGVYDLSPRRRRASWRSFGWIVTRLAWIAARLAGPDQHEIRVKDGRLTVLEERDEVGLRSLLERADGRRLEADYIGVRCGSWV